MRDIKDSELTPERAEKVKELLIKLYEDQYQCKLVPVTSKEQASAQAGADGQALEVTNEQEEMETAK